MVAIFVGCEVGEHALQFIASNKGAIRPHHDIVALGQVAERQQFAHGWDLHLLIVFRVGHWHTAFLFSASRFAAVHFSPRSPSSATLASRANSWWNFAAKMTLANTARAASVSRSSTTVPSLCVLNEARILLFLNFRDVRLRQFRISLKCAPGVRRDKRFDDVHQIAARL